ncbi:MAG: hypothetical protein KGO05_00115 [Chloroflexota bacterium]|nr:hypothetical protein [Chloroflexota bacterium]
MDDDPQAPVFTAWGDTPPRAPVPPPPAPIAPADVDFLTPPLPNTLLLSADIYRPRGGIALALLIGPALCAIVGALVARITGAIPLWLPLALLIWLPLLTLAWAQLKSVRVTAETVACGRPLGAWRSLPFSEIERIEQRGPRLVVRSRVGARLSFSPLLLRRGAELRRRLLLQLPLRALAGDLHAEALALEGDAIPVASENATTTALTVRVARRWPTLAFALALVALAGAAAAFWLLAPPLGLALAIALVALAVGAALLGAWVTQELFVSENGVFVHYRLLRRDRDIIWSRARLLEYGPGGLALRFRGDYSMICAGPGLFTAADARRLREYIYRYAEGDATTTLAHRDA